MGLTNIKQHENMKAHKEFGDIEILSKIGDGVGRRKVKVFLDELFKGIVEQSSKYMNVIDEAPFTYKERQFHSLIAPSIAKLTDAFLMEQPINRQWSKKKKQDLDDSHGWLDYWCRYGEFDYFIELKHNFDAFSTDNIRERTVRNWDTMNNEQLEVVRQEAKNYSSTCKGVFLISLHAIIAYETVSPKSEAISIENKERLLEIQKNYFNSEKLNPKPNWSGLWIVPEKYVHSTSRQLISGSKEYYPSLFLMANVSKLID